MSSKASILTVAAFAVCACTLQAQWNTNAWVPVTVNTNTGAKCLPMGGWYGTTNLYTVRPSTVVTNAPIGTNAPVVVTNSYYTLIQYGGSTNGIDNIRTNDLLNLAVVDWRAVDLYNAIDERYRIVGGTPLDNRWMRFYRSERDNLVSLKSLLKVIINQNMFVDMSAATTNGDFHGRATIPTLNVTSALASASMPTNWFEYTPYRQLDGCGIGYSMLITQTHVQVCGDTNSPMCTNTFFDAWGDTRSTIGTNGQAFIVVATNTAILPGFATLDYGWKHVTNLIAKLTHTKHTPSFSGYEKEWVGTSPTNEPGADCALNAIRGLPPIWADVESVFDQEQTGGTFYGNLGWETNHVARFERFGALTFSDYTCLYADGFDDSDFCADPDRFFNWGTNKTAKVYSSLKRLTLSNNAITTATIRAQWYMYTDTHDETMAVYTDAPIYDGQGIAPYQTNFNLVNTSVVWLVDATTNIYLASDTMGYTNWTDMTAGPTDPAACGDDYNQGFESQSETLVIDWTATGGWKYK